MELKLNFYLLVTGFELNWGFHRLNYDFCFVGWITIKYLFEFISHVSLIIVFFEEVFFLLLYWLPIFLLSCGKMNRIFLSRIYYSCNKNTLFTYRLYGTLWGPSKSRLTIKSILRLIYYFLLELAIENCL